LFRETGRVAIIEPEGFLDASWASILLGLGVMPERYDPFIDLLDLGVVRRQLGGVHDVIGRMVRSMPSHSEFLSRLGG
jgi:hypothetical protein